MNRTFNYSLKHKTFCILWHLRYSHIHIYIILSGHYTTTHQSDCTWIWTKTGLCCDSEVWVTSLILSSLFFLLLSYLRPRSWYHLMHANQRALVQQWLSHMACCCCTFPLNNVDSKTAKTNTSTVYEYKQSLLLHSCPIATGQNPSELLLIAFCLEAI